MRRDRASWLVRSDVEESDQYKSINAVALELGTPGRNALFGYLRKKKILISSGTNRNTPYRRFIEEGYFAVRHIIIERTNGPMPVMQTLVTPAGVTYIRGLLTEDPIPTRR
jgi:anti-repressor protein